MTCYWMHEKENKESRKKNDFDYNKQKEQEKKANLMFVKKRVMSIYIGFPPDSFVVIIMSTSPLLLCLPTTSSCVRKQRTGILIILLLS